MSLTKRPVIALSLSAAFSRHLDKAFVKAQIMPDGVLPTLLVFLKERKLFGDVSVYFTKGSAFGLTVLYRHGDERDVRVGRLGVRRRVWSRGRRRLRLHFRAPGAGRCRRFRFIFRLVAGGLSIQLLILDMFSFLFWYISVSIDFVTAKQTWITFCFKLILFFP